MKYLIFIIVLLCGLPASAQLVYDFNKKVVTLDTKPFNSDVTIKNKTKLKVTINNVNKLVYSINTGVSNVEFFGTGAGGTTASPNLQTLATAISPVVNHLYAAQPKSLLLDYNNAAFKALAPEVQKSVVQLYLDLEAVLAHKLPRFQEIFGIFKKRDQIFLIAKVDDNTLTDNGWTSATNPKLFVNDTQALYDEASDIYVDFYKKLETVKLLDTYATASGKAIIDQLTTYVEATHFDTVLDSYKANQVNIDKDVFSYTSDQTGTEVTGDEALVTITISPRTDLKDNSPVKSLSTQTMTYHIPVIGGWKISFATGLFMSKLTQPRYTFKDTYKTRTPDNAAKTQFDTTAYRTIVEDHNDSWAMGVSALMYYGIRWDKMDEFAFHVGIGTVLQADFKPNYFYGISYLRGYKRRFSINIGFAMGEQTTLSQTADLNRRYDPATTTVPTTMKTVFNKFQFGISYNIFNSAPAATTSTK